jgi:hypothetical protein
MKRTAAILLFFLLLLLVSGCADNAVQVKYHLGLDKMTYDEVLADMAPAWGKPRFIGLSNLRDVIYVIFGELHDAAVANTVYHNGDMLNNATSETKYGNETQWGERYDFYFDKKSRTLMHYCYWKYQDGQMIDNASGRDEIFKDIPGEIFSPMADENAAPVKKAESTMEQKLNNLKDMKDKKVITNEEYKKMREKLLGEY